MSRIGSLARLGSDQLRALNRLREIGNAIAQNTQRLSTLRRINSAKDDPSGLVQATILEKELSAAEATSRSLTRAGSLLSVADSAAGEVVSLLQDARGLALEAAGGTLSSSEIAANQSEIDDILQQVDQLAGTSFAGRRLLDGSAGFSVSGVDTSEILDVDVIRKTASDDVTVAITIDTQATQATNSFTDGDGSLDADTTLVVTGPAGTTTISLNQNDTTQDVTDAFNAVSHLTGITATRIDANQVDFATDDYGSAATIDIEVTEGTFNLTTSATVSGTDAVATVNGASVTGDGSTFNINTSDVALRVEIDPTATGGLSPFTVSGTGLEFTTGPSATDKARIGLPNLHSSSLGGLTGKLSSLRSGDANSLTSGNAQQAVAIIDDAIADALRAQASIGGFHKYSIETSARVVSSTIENLTSSLSAIRDTDVAKETALLAKNRLIELSALEATSIINQRSSSVLNLLRSVSGGV